MSPKTFDVVNDSLLLIANRQPLDVFTGAGPGAAADVAESIRRQFGGLQTRSQQSVHDVIGEERHSAISMMDDKEFARSKQLVADDEGADRIVAGAAAGVANYVCIPFEGPAYLAGSSRGSMQVRIAKLRAGGKANLPFSPKVALHFRFASRTSNSIWLKGISLCS